MKHRLSTPWIATGMAALAIGLSSAALAHGMHDGPQHAERMEQRQARHAEHQAQLKAALKLTPAQEAAWQAFVKDTAHPAAQAQQREDWAKLSTPERLDKMQARKAERDALMKQHIEATKRFYSSLTPEQQKVFDAQTLRHGPHERRGMQGPGDGHRGMHGQGGMKQPG